MYDLKPGTRDTSISLSLEVMLGIEKVYNGMDKGPTVECKVLRLIVKMTSHDIYSISKLWFQLLLK